MPTLTFPDGKIKKYAKPVTGTELAKTLKVKDALSVLVNGEIYDLSRPIAKDAKVKVLTFADPQGKHTFWHSAAHVLAHAISRLYPDALNTLGPPDPDGFHYDFDNLQIDEADFLRIEKEMRKIIQENLPFERVEWTLEDVVKHQGKNPYKRELAQDFKKKGWKITAYRDGDFIDLCEGPHVPSTGYIKAPKLLSLTVAYWRGDQKNKQLTRIKGTAFPSEKELRTWLTLQAEAAKRDHHKLGRELDLFMMNELSPGSPFFLPKGTIIINELMLFLRGEYFKRGYEEVNTPQLFNKALWETSGHWDLFEEFMFKLKVGEAEYGLKPMNCPSHLLIYKAKRHSYRELPIRMADFGNLHRNELSGVLTGLKRVVKMSQDDAHIFCKPEDLQSEIAKLLDFVHYVYGNVFKMKYTANLSTKPDKALGDPKLWKQAESALEQALKKAKIKYEVREGEGAFYGPKIDFDVHDAVGREWQCATIQLDFNMPLRFDATYEGEDGKRHNVIMIHRAILGSLERFIGVLIEHYAGKFPLWLSPVQTRVLSFTDEYGKYADTVVSQLREHGIRAEADTRGLTVGKKVREAQQQKIPYILVVGPKEAQKGTVNVRTRDNMLQEKPVDAFTKQMLKEIAERA